MLLLSGGSLAEAAQYSTTCSSVQSMSGSATLGAHPTLLYSVSEHASQHLIPSQERYRDTIARVKRWELLMLFCGAA